MITKLIKKLPVLFWFVPGFLLYASFPPMGEAADVFFALSPIMLFARRNTPGRSFRCWFVNGLFFWVATLSWMPAIAKNGGPLPLVILGWGALSAYCALYFGAFGWFSSIIWRWTKPRNYGWRIFALAIAEPVLWAGLEIVRSRFCGGFAWNQLGVAPVNAGLGSPAILGGVYLVSMLVILVNGTIASIAERVTIQYFPDKALESVPRWVRSFETMLPFAIVLGTYEISSFVQGIANSPNIEGGYAPLRVAMVQRNMPCVFKEADEREAPLEIYANLFDTVLRTDADLVVLAESALCEFGDVDSANAEAFARFAAKRTGADAVLAGGGRREGARLFNSARLFQKIGDGQVYDKVHLVPFGEFIPGDKILPALQKLAPVGSCTPGELKTLDLFTADGTPVRLGVAICFEDTDSAQMRELRGKGAQLLVFITNDSWFSQSVEARQHAWQAVARAVENALPVVRVGNSGVTGSISAHGEAKWLADENGLPCVDRRGTMCAAVDIPLKPHSTPYSRAGDAPIFTSFIILLAAMLIVNNKTKSRFGKISSL